MSTVDSGFEYREISSASDLDAFKSAWEHAFSRQLHPALFNWLFKQRNRLFIVASDGGVAAGYGLLPGKACLHGKPIQMALCNNVFVTPEYQTKNLFVRLGRFALQEAGRTGAELALGVPNRNAIPGHKRVGWTFLEPTHFLEIRRESLPSPEHAREVRLLTREQCGHILPQIEQLSLRNSLARSFSVLKDAEHFRWRYLERPLVDYRFLAGYAGGQLTGYAVVKYYPERNYMHLIDLECIDDDWCADLVAATRRFAEPFHALDCWDATQYRQTLIALGFQRSPQTNELIAIYPYRREAVDLGPKVNLVLGDNDVY